MGLCLSSPPTIIPAATTAPLNTTCHYTYRSLVTTTPTTKSCHHRMPPRPPGPNTSNYHMSPTFLLWRFKFHLNGRRVIVVLDILVVFVVVFGMVSITSLFVGREKRDKFVQNSIRIFK